MPDENQSRESSKVGAGIDENGDKQHLFIDSVTKALKVALSNPDVGIDLQIEVSDYMFHETTTEGSYPQYIGFVRADSAWYIMKLTDAITASYFKGDSDYTAGWTARASHSYGDWDA